ncbi:MAG TPA: hypothetical protein H9662_07705 [Firmicutes bacterium]|nr:hypothetical protein [Bacillota bacterium]
MIVEMGRAWYNSLQTAPCFVFDRLERKGAFVGVLWLVGRSVVCFDRQGGMEDGICPVSAAKILPCWWEKLCCLKEKF